MESEMTDSQERVAVVRASARLALAHQETTDAE